MQRLVRARARDIALAKTIDACFRAAPVLPKRQSTRKANRKAPATIDVILEAPLAVSSSISLWADGKPLMIVRKLPRQPRYRLRSEVVEGKVFALRLELGSRTYNLSLPISLAGRSELRIVQWAEGAPPRVMLDGVQINRGAGVHMAQVRELPELPTREYGITLKESGVGMLDPVEPVSIYVDDRLVACRPEFSHVGSAVSHVAHVGLGLHRVVVVSKRRNWTIVDTDVVVNGASMPRVEWKHANLSFAEVRVDFGATEFRGPRVSSFFEAASTILYDIQGYSIGGVEIPEGLDYLDDEIERNKEFSEAMARNYRRYWELRLSARRKRERNEPLTDEERWAEDHWDYEEMQRMIAGMKRREGYGELGEAGHTEPDGTIVVAPPDPSDPLDELERRITEHIHEPSHVRGNRRFAESLGLDWDKLVALLRALRHERELRDQGLTEAEIQAGLTPEEHEAFRWARDNDLWLEIWQYTHRHNNAIDLATEELQEYEAEVQFYIELLAKIREDQEERTLVPDPELQRGILYLFGIRESFAGLPEAEKERLRRRLRRLRRSLIASNNFSNEQKAHMLQMIDETLAALG